MTVRNPVVAGAFYAGSRDALKSEIERCFTHELGPGEVPEAATSGPRQLAALVIPHAGYVYSGPVAAHAYGELARDGGCETAILLGPNHSGYGAPVALWARGVWRTPLGDMKIDEPVAASLLGGAIEEDETGHRYEHSIEVQLPWLQYLYEDVKIVPMTMLAQDLETARAVGGAIARCQKDVLVIASTDFSHYEPHDEAARKDEALIEAIAQMNEEELYLRRQSLRATMCGYGPVMAAIVAAKAMGATTGRLLKYATSGNITGDFSSVVGYASLALSR